MSIELTCLLWSAALAFIYLVVHGIAMRRQVGFASDNANRDRDPVPDVINSRGARALRNLLETYPIFIVLVLVAELGQASNPLTQWGAILWLVVRAIYLPLYILGIGRVRSLVWTVSIAALMMMFFGIVGNGG